MVQIILVYDITSDKARSKVADACQDYGLDRIQFSAFSGELSRNHQEELMLRIGSLIGDDTAKVSLIPICDADWKKRLEYTHA